MKDMYMERLAAERLDEIARLKAEIQEQRMQYITLMCEFQDYIPEGYVVAPRKANAQMLDAGVAMALSVTVSGQNGWSNYIGGLYEHMLTHMGPMVLTRGENGN